MKTKIDMAKVNNMWIDGIEVDDIKLNPEQLHTLYDIFLAKFGSDTLEAYAELLDSCITCYDRTSEKDCTGDRKLKKHAELMREDFMSCVNFERSYRDGLIDQCSVGDMEIIEDAVREDIEYQKVLALRDAYEDEEDSE